MLLKNKEQCLGKKLTRPLLVILSVRDNLPPSKSMSRFKWLSSECTRTIKWKGSLQFTRIKSKISRPMQDIKPGSTLVAKDHRRALLRSKTFYHRRPPPWNVYGRNALIAQFDTFSTEIPAFSDTELHTAFNKVPSAKRLYYREPVLICSVLAKRDVFFVDF